MKHYIRKVKITGTVTVEFNMPDDADEDTIRIEAELEAQCQHDALLAHLRSALSIDSMDVLDDE